MLSGRVTCELAVVAVLPVSCRRNASERVRPYDSCRLQRQMAPEVDQVVGDHAQADPPSHALESVIAAARQSMPSFEDADSSLTSGPPLPPLFEPALLLPPAR